tara:strand:+ start:818 stop:1519 length:702 start_codon:yes stop_codon:yes gene_type:complete
MRRFNRNGYNRPVGLFLEFLIILAGITVSFLLNEWRTEKKNKEHKLDLVAEIAKDLKIDSLKLEFSIKTYHLLIRGMDSLTEFESNKSQTDSLTLFLDFFVTYSTFKPQPTSYTKLLSDNELKLNVEDSLIDQFILLHNTTYDLLEEWNQIERMFVLEQALPYLNLNAPYYPTSGMATFDGKVFLDLRKENAFMNLLNTGKSFKRAVNYFNNKALVEVKALQAKINNKLNKQL